jgi:hypothetical protein
MGVACQGTSGQWPDVLLVLLRARAAAEQKFPPCEFRALDAGQQRCGHVVEVIKDVLEIHQHPPRN